MAARYGNPMQEHRLLLHGTGPRFVPMKRSLATTLRPLLFATVLVALIVPQAVWGQAWPGGAVAELAAGGITPERAKVHVDYLASDAMLGRNTPSPELDSAAEYLAHNLKAFGVEPVNGSYFQSYILSRQRLGDTNTLLVNGSPIALRSGFIPYEFTSTGSVSATVVFVGFGISRPGDGYDDYAGVDVHGKIVVAVAGESRAAREEIGGTSFGFDPGPHEKMITAMDKGAVGFLLLPNPLATRTMNPVGFPWPSLYKNVPEDALPWRLNIPRPEPAIPSVSIGADAARAIFNGRLDWLTATVGRIDSTGHPASVELNARIDLRTSLATTTRSVRNVCGVIRGSRLPDEYVVVGAHYDHVGHFRSLSPGTGNRNDTIYNGADDNASGTTGALLGAEALASVPLAQRPARSVVVIFFSGEEKGLYGSRAWTAEPPIPLEKTVAMLNMDMIGRNFPDSVSVAGKLRSPEMGRIAIEANRAEPMILADDLEEMFFRSDQASFAARRIPVLYFSSGTHVDYHEVSDSPEKIDHKKLARIARLCFRAAWLAADAEDRPVYEGTDEHDTPMSTIFNQ